MKIKKQSVKLPMKSMKKPIKIVIDYNQLNSDKTLNLLSISKLNHKFADLNISF